MDIIAKSPVYEVVKIVKPTGAKFFKDLRVGDKLQFSTVIGYLGRGRGLYAPTVKIEHILYTKEHYQSFNELNNRLMNFELKEVKLDIE